jgi:sugar phosphate isomerase/epimerase
MSDIHVGVNLPGCGANPARMEEWLDASPLIIGGEVRREYVDFVRGALGADPLVLHYELESRDAVVEELFLEAHREAADHAARLGLRLCIENIEVELVEPVVDFVRRVDRPNFLMNFDTGHAFLASWYFHFDFLESLRAALPVLGHVHLNDNTGVFEELRITDRPRYDGLSMGYRRTFSRGDIHVPPFWGAIPFPEVFALLKDYRGLFVCEYAAEAFMPFNRSVQEKVRKAIGSARGG